MTSRSYRPPVAKANVPRPSLKKFTAHHLQSKKQRSKKSRWDLWAAKAAWIARRWSFYSPIFELPGVSINELAARPKPSERHKAAAQAQIDLMQDWPSDACSGRWVDKESKLMIAYFADRIVRKEVSPAQPVYFSQTQNMILLGR